MKGGDLVKVHGLEGVFKVVSVTSLGKSQKLELFSLKNNKIVTFLSPPMIVESLLSPLELVLSGGFENSDCFDLMVEANRLSCMYLYDPLLSLSSTKITVYPHQVEAVYRMLETYWPRYLLADDAGLGKTIMAGMLIKELELRRRITRVLIVVPAALLYQWRRELLERFGEKFTVMDSSRINSCYEDQPESNPWSIYDQVMTSMDFAKRESVLDGISGADWDLVIVDEAHKLAAHRFGAKTFRTRRFVLGEALQDASNCLLFLTATPHSGESYAYYRLLSLIDPYLFAREGYVTKDKLKRVMIRRTKEDVRTLDDKPLFPPREAKTLVVPFSPDESNLYASVVHYVTHYFNLATTAKNRGVSFAMMILQKRMASSIAAITKSLENRQQRLIDLRQFGRLQDFPELEIQEMEEEGVNIEDLEDKEKEEMEKKYEVLTMATNLKELNQEIDILSGLVERARAVTRDSKADALVEFVSKTHEQDPLEKILIFTEYKDTLNYLVERLEPIIKRWNVEIATIHGGMKLEERVTQEERFKEPNVPIMVATDAAGEGLNLQFAHLMVNYELPWNPNRLEQRIGRLHRIGQDKKVFVHNMLIENTIEGEIFQRLLDKIETIKEEIGDRVFDVLGLLLSNIRIEDLVMQAVGKSSAWVETQMSSVEVMIDDAKRSVLQEIESKSLIKDALDMGTVQKLLGKSNEARLTDVEIERFMHLFLKTHGGKLEGSQTEKGIFTIDLPRILENDKKICQSLYVEGWKITSSGRAKFRACKPITFCKEIAEKNEDARFVALGHPLLSKIIQICMEPDFGGKATIKQNLSGETGALFVFKSRIMDLVGNLRAEKLITVMWDKTNNHFREVDPAGFWELDKGAKNARVESIVENSEFFTGVYRQAEEVAIKLTEDVVRETKSKVERETSIKTDDIKNYQSNAMNLLRERIIQSKRRLQYGAIIGKDEQDRLKQNIGRDEARTRRLEKITEEELEKLKHECQLVYEAPECLGIAVLTPEMAGKKQCENEGSGAQMKIDVEKAGVEFVLKYEEEHDRKPIDVSPMFKGYDVVSEGMGEKRYIEVKSFSETGPLELTSHEWIVSQRLGKNYWLYVVENALSPDKRSMIEVCDPFNVFAKIAQEMSILQFKILIEGWKDLLKGAHATEAVPC
jgi:superfamily II DNA or RNA helicase